MEFIMNEEMKDAIIRYIKELDIDAVGLWQIVPDQKEFNLSDDDFKNYFYDVILSLMKNGAIPVKSPYISNWDEITIYGNEPNDIANNIIAMWVKNKQDKSIFSPQEGIWFKRP